MDTGDRLHVRKTFLTSAQVQLLVLLRSPLENEPTDVFQARAGKSQLCLGPEERAVEYADAPAKVEEDRESSRDFEGGSHLRLELRVTWRG